MKKSLGAGDILANIKKLKGFETNRQLAEFFGVCPSAVTDWVNRKGDRIPDRRLADVSRVHSISWRWLVYGEGAPFDGDAAPAGNDGPPDPDIAALLARLRASPQFRRAVRHLIGLDDTQMKLVSQLSESLAGRNSEAYPPPREQSYRKWTTCYPLLRDKPT